MTMQTLPGMEAAERPKRGKFPEKHLSTVRFAMKTAVKSQTESLTALVAGKITKTISEMMPEWCEKNPVAVTMLTMLEKRGLHRGLDVADAVTATDLSEGTVRKWMSVAAKMVEKVFGLIVGFINNDGIWKLGYGEELVVYARRHTKYLSTYARNKAPVFSAVLDQLPANERQIATRLVPMLKQKEAKRALNAI